MRKTKSPAVLIDEDPEQGFIKMTCCGSVTCAIASVAPEQTSPMIAGTCSDAMSFCAAVVAWVGSHVPSSNITARAVPLIAPLRLISVIASSIP